MPGPDEDPTTKHEGIWWRLFFSGIWLVYLAYPVSQLFGHRHSAAYIAGGLALVAVFCVIYVYLLYEWDRLGANPYGWLAAMAAVAAVTSVVYDGGGALWIYVSASAGAVIRQERQAFRTVLVVTAAYAVFGLTQHGDMTTFLVNLVPTMLVGLAMIGC
jgi:two-component system sensor histidine kinase DesK